MKNFMIRMSDAAFKPLEISNGINNFKSGKFYLVLLCYLAGTIFFIRDPFFKDQWGDFSYGQSALVLFSALVIMSSLHWDIMLFGKPAGANFILQLTSMMPFVLFYARITGRSHAENTDASLFGKAMDYAAAGVKMLINFELPQWFTDLFSNWQSTLLLVLILMVFCFRNPKIRISALIVLLLVPFCNVLAYSQERLFLAFGTLFMLGGLAMQYSDYASYVYYLNIINALKVRRKMDENYLRCIMRIMHRLDDDGKILENEVTDIVKSEYGTDNKLAPADVRLISGEILRNMMNEFNLISMKLTPNGITANANMRLYNSDSILTYAAVLPRVVMILMITFIFVISPLDIIPDSLPFIGVLDDMALTAVSFFVTKNSLEAHREK